MRHLMSSNKQSTEKLLTKAANHEPVQDDHAANSTRSTHAINSVIALISAAILAFALLPPITILKQGDLAPRELIAPYMLYVEYEGPEQTTISLKVNKDDIIVAAGQRVSSKAEHILGEIARREGIGSRVQAFGGLYLLMLALLYLFYRDVKRYRPALTADRKRFFLLSILVTATVLMSYGAKHILVLIADTLHLDLMTIGFALPVASGSMLVTLLFDFHLALSFSFIVSILIGILFPGEPFLAVYFLLSSLTAALSVIQCKKRTALLRAAAMTAIVNLLVIAGIDLYRGAIMERAVYDAVAGVLSALLMSTVVSASLPFFEALFDIATDIKLLELLDPNHPLLKELVYKSPGTYHHSIVIGNLAEAAAEAIGENPILARIGAYYHDIGKTLKPEYFIENQRPSENKHDRLMPSMSSLIIAAHVRDGVELARSQRLPAKVVDIIQQHHGTSLITYFYQKAKEQQPFGGIAEENYRYPGPRPSTKVAAIVMLSDNVEAASRTLDDPSPARIQALTNSVITRIFLDDQLSMCDLTLKDLRVISKSFNLVLTGIFHHRIDYPGIVFPGDKRRSDHQDKKQPEEKKAGNFSA